MGFSQPTVSLGDFYGSMVVSIWNSSMTFINQLFFSVGQGHVTNTGSISCAKTNNKLFNFSGLESHPFLVKLGIVHEHGFIIFIILHIHLCSWYSYYTSMFMMFILYIYVHDVHIIHLCSYIKCIVFFLHLDHPLAPWPWRFFPRHLTGIPRGQDEEALICEVLASNALFRTSVLGWVVVSLKKDMFFWWIKWPVFAWPKRIGQDETYFTNSCQHLEEDQQASPCGNMLVTPEVATLLILDCFFRLLIV